VTISCPQLEEGLYEYLEEYLEELKYLEEGGLDPIQKWRNSPHMTHSMVNFSVIGS